MNALALARLRLVSFTRSRDTRERGVETSSAMHLGRFLAGWHARMSSRLAGKGACALCIASVSNIRLRPSPRLDTGGRQMRIIKLVAVLAASALAFPTTDAVATATKAAQARRPALAPSPAFLRLCVASDVVPMMFRLYRMVDLLKENGRTIVWQPTATGWILRERWLDDLDQRRHEVSFLFTALRGAVTGAYCPPNSAEVSMQRIVVDGVEMTGTDVGQTFDTQAKAVYGEDRPPPGYPPVPRNRLGGFATGLGLGDVLPVSEMGAP